MKRKMEYYYSFGKYVRKRFDSRVYKLSVNPGFTCPNVDGTLSNRGCIFCNEYGFSDSVDVVSSVEEQIIEAMKKTKHKKNQAKFIAYFQNGAGTNAPTKVLKKMYDSLKQFPEIVGISISTRPDCIDENKLELIKTYLADYDVWIEYGVQSSKDKTLKLINRNHTFSGAVDAIVRTHQKGIKVGAHIVLGLPKETSKDMADTAKKIAKLPVDGIKLHGLHVLKNTYLHEMYKKGKIKLLTREEYIEITCDFLEYLRQDQIIQRVVSDAREKYLIAPVWINDKANMVNDINRRFKERGTYQGSKYNSPYVIARES